MAAAKKSTSKTVTTKLVTRTVNEVEFQLATDGLAYTDTLAEVVDSANNYTTAKVQFYGDQDFVAIFAPCGELSAVIKTDELVALGTAVKAAQK